MHLALTRERRGTILAAVTLVLGASFLLAALVPPRAEAMRLLAPKSQCRGQLSSNAPDARQQRAMMCLHRYARRRAGRSRVVRSRPLSRSAKRKSRDLRRCSFSHTACGRGAFDYVVEEGFGGGCFTIAAENIGTGTRGVNARMIMRGWLRSPGHRRNILRRGITRAGFGLVKGRAAWNGRFRRHWTAHLGRPC